MGADADAVVADAQKAQPPPPVRPPHTGAAAGPGVGHGKALATIPEEDVGAEMEMEVEDVGPATCASTCASACATASATASVSVSGSYCASDGWTTVCTALSGDTAAAVPAVAALSVSQESEPDT